MFNRGGPKAGLTVDNTINTIKLGYFWGQLSQTQNWTVLTSTYIQLLVFHFWKRLYTVNMEITDSNILSQYELPKMTYREMLKPNGDAYISGSLKVTSRLMHRYVNVLKHSKEGYSLVNVVF